jgi:hypothetical protein
MPLIPGNAACTTGLSKRCYDYWTADPGSGFVSPLTDAARTMIRAQCYAFARAVVDEFQANGLISIDIDADDLDPGIPSVLRTINGGIT